MSDIGFVSAALSIGFGSFRIRPVRGFYAPAGPALSGGSQFLSAHATLEEIHRDDMEVTEHPVEIGAPVADHAFMRPPEVIIRCGWSNSPPGSPGLLGAALGAAGVSVPIVGKAIAAGQTFSAAQSILTGNGASQVKAIYAQLLQLQASRIPFNIYTGKRVYKNMLFKSLGCTTDAEHENSLSITATCKGVLIVATSTVQLPVNPDAQANPQKTSPVTDAGQKQLNSSPLGSGFFGIN